MVEVDPQAVHAAFNHAKGMVKHLARLLGRDVLIIEVDGVGLTIEQAEAFVSIVRARRGTMKKTGGVT